MPRVAPFAAVLTALALVTAGPPPATADEPREIGYNDGETGFTVARVSDVQASFTPVGECGFTAASDPTADGLLGGQDSYTGEISARVVVYSADDPAVNPIPATVTCDLKVNGVTQDSASASGLGLVVVADTLTYVATERDSVDICTTVDAAGDTSSWCLDDTTTTQFPPQEVIDLLSIPDSVLCPMLAGLAPGAPGVLEVDSDGDLTVAGEPFWDCPPYEPYGSVPAAAPTDAHDVVSGCSFKLSRHTGLVTIVGRAHVGRHPTAAAASIRCRLVDATTGTVLYDQTRSEAGSQARLEEVVSVLATRITVCTAAHGWWNDGHDLALPLRCQAG